MNAALAEAIGTDQPTGFRPLAVVCVPTFRRPQMLSETLASLERQQASFDFAVVVVENDPADTEGLEVASTFIAQKRLLGVAIVERKPGNCAAINAAFDAARRLYPSAEYFLMIDDDELASDSWLETMVDTAEDKKIDIVGGPVLPRFPQGTDHTFTGHPVYWPAFSQSRPVPMIYGSGNCLIRRSVFARLDRPDFDLAFNYLGGGDTDFFTRCRRAGLRFYWAQEAQIFETVTPNRLTRAWLLQRGIRIGAINYKIDRAGAKGIAGFARLAAKNVASLGLSLARSARLALQRKPLMVVLHPIVVSSGRMIAAFGFYPEVYGLKPKRSAA